MLAIQIESLIAAGLSLLVVGAISLVLNHNDAAMAIFSMNLMAIAIRLVA